MVLLVDSRYKLPKYKKFLSNHLQHLERPAKNFDDLFQMMEDFFEFNKMDRESLSN